MRFGFTHRQGNRGGAKEQYGLRLTGRNGILPPMNSVELKFGIPDVEFTCASGRKVNPASFAGHDLIVLFGPLDPVASAQEIAAYRDLGAEFVASDAWLLAFADECADNQGAARVLTIPDPDRRAWIAFRDMTAHPEEMDRSSGAVFLFTRGGNLHRYWHGSGHVGEIIAELRTPSFHHPHQLAH